ncbi:hypothetical protein GCM10025856_22110 [Methylophaga marina]|uniref:Uncharacterized protein n=1 Tax=Methylophaga marina TaxID=45495 RepID=A0ABN0TNV7_9GAMM|nr:hypothetical protein GCM10025856_22110 [Methylophaga marina]
MKPQSPKIQNTDNSTIPKSTELADSSKKLLVYIINKKTMNEKIMYVVNPQYFFQRMPMPDNDDNPAIANTSIVNGNVYSLIIIA